ncbi:MAG: flavodoxin family protein [Defluviitaleaceae bacterium]|nr:flavodoxin family protein [Defluviitaleaceae bacterium]
MKILVIDGSPRGEQSNTMVLTKAFLEGAGWAENAEFVSVPKLDIKGCVGCFTCWTATPGVCDFKDDMAEILPKIVAADVLIWSFPLYSSIMPGQLKIFMDRMLPLNLPEMMAGTESGQHPLRYDMSKKKYMMISTCGFWTHKGNYDAVMAMFSRGAMDFQTIFAGQGELFKIAKVDDELKELVTPFLNNVRKAGKEFAEGEIAPETQAVLAEPLLPQEVYESFANASW